MEQIRAALYESGISLSLIYDIVAMMEQKPLRVQRAFLLRLQGKTQQEIADEIGVPRRTVSRLLSRDCADVSKKIQESCMIVAKTGVSC